MKVTPSLLHRVQTDNMRTHQFGDAIEDGVDYKTAKNLGFSHPDEVDTLVHSLGPEQLTAHRHEIAPMIGREALTSAEMNANERRRIAEHKARTVKQVYDPYLN